MNERTKLTSDYDVWRENKQVWVKSSVKKEGCVKNSLRKQGRVKSSVRKQGRAQSSVGKHGGVKSSVRRHGRVKSSVRECKIFIKPLKPIIYEMSKNSDNQRYITRLEADRHKIIWYIQ
jgi:hypothetical protein